MRPIQFLQANIVMKRPRNMTEEECCDIHAFQDGKQVVTAWIPTPEELVKINLGQPVYLLLVGSTMQPALVTADSPFLDNEAVCEHCGKPATCYGRYEGGKWQYACDDCCGHGNEDGTCIPLKP